MEPNKHNQGGVVMGLDCANQGASKAHLTGNLGGDGIGESSDADRAYQSPGWGYPSRTSAVRPVPKKYSGGESIVIRGKGSGGETDLPAGIIGKSSDLHSVRSSTRPGCHGALVIEGAGFAVSGTASKLDGQAFAHEIRSIFESKSLARKRTGAARGGCPSGVHKRTKSCRRITLLARFKTVVGGEGGAYQVQHPGRPWRPCTR